MNKLTFDDIEVSKKEFYKNKTAMKLNVIKLKKIMKQVNFLLVFWMMIVVLIHLYVLFRHK